jgi:hypothetical protein
MDVLYKHQSQVVEDHTDSLDEEEGGGTEGEEGDAMDDFNEEIFMTENFYLEEYPEDTLLPDLSVTYREVIGNIRAIVKSFRHERNLC